MIRRAATYAGWAFLVLLLCAFAAACVALSYGMAVFGNGGLTP